MVRICCVSGFAWGCGFSKLATVHDSPIVAAFRLPERGVLRPTAGRRSKHRARKAEHPCRQVLASKLCRQAHLCQLFGWHYLSHTVLLLIMHDSGHVIEVKRLQMSVLKHHIKERNNQITITSVGAATADCFRGPRGRHSLPASQHRSA